MENGTISLVMSAAVALMTVVKFFFAILSRKEAAEDKFAKASSVANELTMIKKDISNIEDKLDDYGVKIGNVQMQAAVLNAQSSAQLRELEKLGYKMDEWRNNE